MNSFHVRYFHVCNVYGHCTMTCRLVASSNWLDQIHQGVWDTHQSHLGHSSHAALFFPSGAVSAGHV
ncbi:hypothetical protein ACFX2H_033399 [Malus domestica]